MIKLQVIGHLGKDATTNAVNGKTVINFSVAHTEKYTSNGEKHEKATWVECAYWSDKTALVPYLKKGTQVYAEGSADVRTWESNGKSGASLQMRVVSVQLLGGGHQQGANEQQRPVQQQAAAPAYDNVPDETTDSLPF